MKMAAKFRETEASINSRCDQHLPIWNRVIDSVSPNDFVGLHNDLITDACARERRLDWNRSMLQNSQVKSRLQPGSVVLDIGAHIGDTTKLFADRECLVYAFEPRQDAFHCLSKNFDQNEFVKPFCAAVGEPGQTVVLCEQFEYGNPGSRRVELGPGLPVVAIDELALARCDFIKIDAQGFEPHVLRGARDTLQRHKPLVYCEVSSAYLAMQGFTESDLYETLKSLGYGFKIVQDPVHANFDILCHYEDQPTRKLIQIHFEHGLGDCANFAHVLGLYKRRGYDIAVSCTPDKELVFKAAGAVIESSESYPRIHWWEAHHPPADRPDHYWEYNKAAINVSAEPLAAIGSSCERWSELKDLQLSIKPLISQQTWRTVRQLIDSLPRPVVLLHTMGNTSSEQKNLPPDTTTQLYAELLNRTDGSIILLDWDNRMPRLASYRVRHLTEDLQGINIEELCALMFEADLMVGIDSGPLHLSRLTDIPTVGLFPTLDKYPPRYVLPKPNQVNLVPGGPTHEMNRRTRLDFNIIEGGHEDLQAELIADAAIQMLEAPRYFHQPVTHRGNLGADVLLRDLVSRAQHRNAALSDYVDRHRSFDLVFRLIRERFIQPAVVETGCIRSVEDWSAGYGTYLIGAYLRTYGGSLVSVDFDEKNCAFAREMTKGLPVSVVCQDSVIFLAKRKEAIDVLYLDSMDTDQPEHDTHALNEIQAAYPHLRETSIVIIDDTVFRRNTWVGKGAVAVPWLLERNWKILYAGYQVVLSR